MDEDDVENEMDKLNEGPTYDQMAALGNRVHEFISRTTKHLNRRQQKGPTRISGMIKELDMASEDAIKEWAEELNRVK